MDMLEKIQLIGTRNLRRREVALHTELETLRWAMESMPQLSTCRILMHGLQGLDCNNKGPYAWSSFATKLKVIKTL